MQPYKALFLDGAGRVLFIDSFDTETDAAALAHARGLIGAAASVQVWGRQAGTAHWRKIPEAEQLDGWQRELGLPKVGAE